VGETQKVTLEVSINTYRVIEEARAKLAQNPTFSWVKHLSPDEFLDFFFGLTEVSQFCRKTLMDVFEGIKMEELAKPISLKETTPKDKIVVTANQKKVIDCLIDKNMPLTITQISQLIGLSKEKVNNLVDELKRRGILTKVPNSHAWQLTTPQKTYEVKREIKESLIQLLKASKTFMSTMELAEKLHTKRKTISQYLWELKSQDLVERTEKGNETFWKYKQN
jgi:predicted transcriptional regulator